MKTACRRGATTRIIEPPIPPASDADGGVTVAASSCVMATAGAANAPTPTSHTATYTSQTATYTIPEFKNTVGEEAVLAIAEATSASDRAHLVRIRRQLMTSVQSPRPWAPPPR